MGSLCLCIEDPVVRPNYIVGNLRKPKEFTYEITQPCIDYCQNIWAEQPNIYKRLIGKNILGRIRDKENVLNRRYKDQDFYDTCALLRLKCNNTLNKETIPVVLHFFVHCRDLFFDYVQFTSFFVELWIISQPKNYLGGGRDFIRCQRFDFADLSDWPYYGVMTRKEITNFFTFLQKHVRCRHMHWKSLMMSNVERRASRLQPLNKQKHLLFQRQLIDFLMSSAKACDVFYMHCRNFIYKPMEFFHQFVESYLNVMDVSLIIPTLLLRMLNADKVAIDQQFLQHYFATITELDERRSDK
uniref:Uncharacterized protein n=1 Tax=Ditylenchus dipsaci TaxID=166011 RepID=A0A915DX11_9BILA